MTAQPSFATRLIEWQRGHGRHDLPWQVADPYRVWLSEVMLQQTQVTTVIPYFLNFLQRFPDVAALAAAPLDAVLAAWSGLGYYSRARNLHQAAQQVMREHGGRFPATPEALVSLPGIGRSTAAAIAVFAFGARAAILDGNVKRVLTRWAGVEGWPGERAIEQQLWQQAEALLPMTGVPAYTQGLMDLGSLLCTRSKPRCLECPLAADCQARLSGRQGVLPTPKPRKTLPERQVVMLLLRHQGRLLLERRPESGIWGGLWSLPEVPDTLTAAQCCAERYGLQVDFAPPLAELRHTFTHFHLTITPLPGDVLIEPSSLSAQCAWVNDAEAQQLGLPAPVRKLLVLR